MCRASAKELLEVVRFWQDQYWRLLNASMELKDSTLIASMKFLEQKARMEADRITG
jgi:hypothetical protein